MNSKEISGEIKIELPDDVKEIIKKIQSEGFEAYAVGGCVRDSILGKEPDDWDITTSAKPEQVKKMFSRTVDTGLSHGTVTIMMGKTGYEVTTYRIDGEYKDGRHPEKVVFSSDLTEDLKRRDFTINAMATDGIKIVDEFDGIGDLENKLIKCVGVADERFNEDALRMMRAVRFSAQLGFSIEDKTYEAVKQHSKDIKKVSMERVQTELIKTLMSKNPEYVKKYHETGLFAEILPLIDELLSGKYAENNLNMLRNVPDVVVLRYAALLNNSDPIDAQNTLKTLKLDNYTIKTTTKLLEYSKDNIEESEPAVREAIYKYGKDMMPLIFAFKEASIKTSEDIFGLMETSRKKKLMMIKKIYEGIIERGDCIQIKDLDITGNDLMELGFKGQDIGNILKDLLHNVLENPRLNEKETLIAIVKQEYSH